MIKILSRCNNLI
uniref:Uncharacterized protein n=1 Tax=Rhizophora mucronata TaxID=61149 RepID=A0A2P2Q0N1_RHIMU